ncbi:aldo/keto reductase [Phytoactinopolyspora mesophila]|uniref:Aldo/keto reductase n=1 Tax=Phytoactinopolyspora mesophila TaxID=2650750 RepID=A0A7K3M0T2_9ACTN|nr:aldo/keto reductase [Phytoactinopolyspora mesophila]NDL56860.1 aldo/keto reductase [Phytoactinopolyspora mesophila]
MTAPRRPQPWPAVAHAPGTTPEPTALAVLGRTGVPVTRLCLGTSKLGKTTVADDAASATLDEAFRIGLTIDTSNEYGDGGRSEERVGAAWRRHEGTERPLVATKVDPRPGNPDFSGERVRASARESLERLGLQRLPLLSLHDPERIAFDEAISDGGPLQALLALHEEGVAGPLGVAGGPVALLERFVETGHFDYVVTHNRFTLLDRSAESLLDLCHENGVGVFNAAPFGGGLLARSTRDAADAKYAYQPAPTPLVEAARQMEQACARHGVELAAAALQMSMRDPRVHSTIVGVSGPEQLRQSLALASREIPATLFDELHALTPDRAHWIGPQGP